MHTTTIGHVTVSRFILGSNPFSTFSHQGEDVDLAMRRYFTTARIKAVMRDAEGLGISGLIARGDHHVLRLLFEYREEGGTLQWFAQTCPELGSIARGVQYAIQGGAVACHIHGGVMDNLVANHRLDEVPEAIKMIRDAGMIAGMAGHTPAVFRWAEEHVDVDYYMCSYYNPIPRTENPEHQRGFHETYLEEDRAVMTATIAGLSKPVIHYKVLAAGRNAPRDAFAYVAQHLRPQDAVCVGVYPEHQPTMLADDVALFSEACAAAV
jgi:hypothetical protein